MPFRAFLDANVLVSARLRDVLLTLAEVALYEARWSPVVLAEVERHLPSTMAGDVVAAAVFSRSEALVTSDCRLRQELESYPELIEAQTPSAFVAYAIDSDLSCAGSALLNMAARRWLAGAESAANPAIRDRLAVWARRELGDAVSDLILQPEFRSRVG
ncbi:hypothetical protein [Nocardia sp. CC227C]|uniref:hypothetical protein n=1 Tax=Nocardia sp. CC227C TaxID=3044562 RepID=UPI00278C27FD|nr:hypothetical protein [Nocardia sp. CC227C]